MSELFHVRKSGQEPSTTTCTSTSTSTLTSTNVRNFRRGTENLLGYGSLFSAGSSGYACQSVGGPSRTAKNSRKQGIIERILRGDLMRVSPHLAVLFIGTASCWQLLGVGAHEHKSLCSRTSPFSAHVFLQ